MMFQNIKEKLLKYDVLVFGLGLVLGIFGIYNLLLSTTNQEWINQLVSTGITFVGIGLAYAGAKLAIEADKQAYTNK